MPTIRVALSSIKPNPDNPRIIKDDKFRKLVASIRSFPEMLELRPIVVNADNVVLGGNMRLRACQEAGMKEVPVLRADTLTPDQQREFIIKDNVGFGDWNWDDLANTWDAEELDAWGLDVPFVEKTEEGLTDPDEVPEPPADPITKPGDLILLGKHRLYCGDSGTSTTWDKLMPNEEADMVWTDPPYGVSYVGKTKDALTIQNDSLDDAGLQVFLEGVFGFVLPFTREGGAWYVAAPAGPLQRIFDNLLFDLGVLRQCLSWTKDAFVLGRSDYHYRHEPIFYGWRPGAAHTWNGGRDKDSVLEFDRPRVNKEHPTMKPVALVEYCIRNSSNPGNIVLDPFGGSGTTLLASQKAGRVARIIEIDPKYCDVIVKRWEDFTGEKAVRETGKEQG